MAEHTPSLDNKTALITGAARRIGAVVARCLHAVGMNVVIHYQNSTQAAQALQMELESQRSNSVSLIQADLNLPAAYAELIQHCENRWAGLHVLINNASSFYPTPLGEVTESAWLDLMGTNLKAPLFLSQAAAPLLRQSSGCIINMVDIHAQRPQPAYPVYCAAKAGLIALTQSLAIALGPQVRVNAIAPGYMLPPEAQSDAMHATKRALLARTALAREGSPQDIAKAVLFLVRDADYITGEILKVDGGRY